MACSAVFNNKKSETNNIKYHQKDLLIITTIGILAWIPEACEAWGVSRYKPPQSRFPSLELLNGSFYINMWYDSSCRCYALRLLNQSSFGIFKVSFICRSVYHPACTLRSFPVSSTTSFRTCRLHSSCRRLCLGVMWKLGNIGKPNISMPKLVVCLNLVMGPCSARHPWTLGSTHCVNPFPCCGSVHKYLGYI